VKIEGTCRECGREVTGDQVIQGGGECPWCGTPFSADYALVVVNAVRDAQDAGTKLERALEALADVAPNVRIEDVSVLGDLRRSLARIDRPAIPQG
jgi:hypothetical protein